MHPRDTTPVTAVPAGGPCVGERGGSTRAVAPCRAVRAGFGRYGARVLNLNQVAGVAAHVAGRPVALVQGVESLLEKLNEVAVRAIQLLDAVDGVPERVVAVVGTAEQVAARVESTVGTAEQVAARVDATVAKAEALATQVDGLAARAAKIATKADKATDQATGIVTSVQPLVDAVGGLDPATVRKIEPLLEDVLALLPMLASLPPVIEKLAVQVDHLDQTVADVGALLQGIPGAGRLLKRGSTTGTGTGFPAR